MACYKNPSNSLSLKTLEPRGKDSMQVKQKCKMRIKN